MFFLTKLKSGLFSPTYPADHDSAARIPIGQEVRCTQPRNLDFHRKFFALLQLGFQNQDKYTSFEVYRKIITIDAGYYDEAINKDGVAVPIPRSIAFENMSQQEFEKYYAAVLDVMVIKLQTAKEEIINELINFM